MRTVTAYAIEFEVAGCQDDMACNYDADATDRDGSLRVCCDGYDCDGNCLSDADGDGVCDDLRLRVARRHGMQLQCGCDG